MLSTAIQAVLEKDPFTALVSQGVFARDKLPTRVNYPSCFIFNTDNHDKPGTHWLAIFYDKYGNCDFFDSYGNHPSFFKLTNYLNMTSKTWKHNNKCIQAQSEYCGYYCLLFLFLRCRNSSAIFFKYFSKKPTVNDKLVMKLINSF